MEKVGNIRKANADTLTVLNPKIIKKGSFKLNNVL